MRRCFAFHTAKLCFLLDDSLEMRLKLLDAVKPNPLRYVVSETQLYVAFKWLEQLQILRTFVFLPAAFDHLEKSGCEVGGL
jgi:hypothetical protein